MNTINPSLFDLENIKSKGLNYYHYAHDTIVEVYEDNT